MFTLLRGVIIVGLIFHFSPARDPGRSAAHSGEERRKPASTDAPRPYDSDDAQAGAWSGLVGSLGQQIVRTTANDQALSIGLRLRDNGAQTISEASRKAAASVRSQSYDGQPALRGSQDPSLRCVYRCDGAE